MSRSPLLAASLALAALTLSTPASAQTRVSGGEFRTQDVRDESLLRRGRFEVGLQLAGAMSFGSTTPDGGESISQTNLFLSPALVIGMMVTDRVEVRLTPGVQILGTKVGEGTAIGYSFAGTLQVLYQHPLTLGLSASVGAGAGGFYGYRFAEAGPGTRVQFNRAGGIGQVLLGLLMEPGPRLLLRGDLRLDAVFGSESVADDAMTQPGASFFTVQVAFQVGIGVRFGG